MGTKLSNSGKCAFRHSRPLGMWMASIFLAVLPAALCAPAMAATYGPLNPSLARCYRNTSTTASETDLRIPAFNNNSQISRVVVQYPMTTAPAQNLVTNVKFRVWQDCGTGLYSNVANETYRCTAQVYPLNQSIGVGVNWDTRDGTTPWATGGGSYGAQVGGDSAWYANCGNWFEWNWVSPVPICGMMLRGTQEGAADSLYRRKVPGNGAQGGAPTLQIDYTPPTGSPNVIRDWDIIGFYSEADHDTRYSKDFFDPAGTDPLVDEANMAAKTGVTYNGKAWQTITSTTDDVKLADTAGGAGMPFTNSGNGASYGFSYVKFDGYPGTYTGGVTLAQPGALGGDSNTAALFSGSNGHIPITIDVSETAYSVELWFKTTTATEGIFQVNGGGYDRDIWLAAGKVSCRVYTEEALVSGGATTYNNGAWHHVVHTLGSTGQKLYVDGALVASGSKTFSDFNWQTSIDIGYSAWSGCSSSPLMPLTTRFSEALGANTPRVTLPAMAGRTTPTIS